MIITLVFPSGSCYSFSFCPQLAKTTAAAGESNGRIQWQQISILIIIGGALSAHCWPTQQLILNVCRENAFMWACSRVVGGSDLVNCPTRWPLSLLFGYMWWSPMLLHIDIMRHSTVTCWNCCYIEVRTGSLKLAKWPKEAGPVLCNVNFLEALWLLIFLSRIIHLEMQLMQPFGFTNSKVEKRKLLDIF